MNTNIICSTCSEIFNGIDSKMISCVTFYSSCVSSNRFCSCSLHWRVSRAKSPESRLFLLTRNPSSLRAPVSECSAQRLYRVLLWNAKMCMMCRRRARERRFFAPPAISPLHSLCVCMWAPARASRVLWGYSPLRCDMCPFSASVHNSVESYFYLPLGGGHQTDGGPRLCVFTYWVRAERLTRKIFCVCVSLTGIICARGEYFLLLGHIKQTELGGRLCVRHSRLLASGAIVKKLNVVDVRTARG